MGHDALGAEGGEDAVGVGQRLRRGLRPPGGVHGAGVDVVLEVELVDEAQQLVRGQDLAHQRLLHRRGVNVELQAHQVKVLVTFSHLLVCSGKYIA